MNELVANTRHCEDLLAAQCHLLHIHGAYDSDSRAAATAAGYTLACATIGTPVLEAARVASSISPGRLLKAP
jgi:hypothetical protein